MRAIDLITKKKRGEAHSPREMEWLIHQFMQGSLPDYQLAAWLMAVCFQGMNPEETWHFTRTLARSGRTFRWEGDGLRLDKHSTGGVGDSTSLIVVPVVTSLGFPMVKLSGRGLGHTGGTIDKLAAIPGLKTRLDQDEINRVLKAVGMVIAGQSQDMAPADGLIYQLRDVTATVDSIPLIAASIMAKKIAAGAEGLVLDVKTGSGALMSTLGEARSLADAMLHIACRSGIKTCSLISDMNQPLSSKVGNALEVEAALEVLSGSGCRRLRQLSLELAACLLGLGTGTSRPQEQYAQAQAQLDSGAALEQFTRWVKEQGGDLNWSREGPRLGRARESGVLRAPHSGFVGMIDARLVGEAALRLGAGRQKKDEPIDPGAGIILEVEVGSPVAADEPLAWVFGSTPGRVATARTLLTRAFTISKIRSAPPPLVLERRD